MKEFFFTVDGKPRVQKNGMEIHRRKVNGKFVPFISHSKEFEEARDAIALRIFQQYGKQNKNTKPIDYLIEVEFVFYVKKQHEPDLDNLPAAYLDAMQRGVKVKGSKKRIAQSLKDDKLVRKLTATKIVKGDLTYDGNPRAEITIRRYNHEA